MHIQSLSGSPSVPSSSALTDALRLLTLSEERKELGDADLVVRRSSIATMTLVDVVGPTGQGVMASMSSIILLVVDVCGLSDGV